MIKKKSATVDCDQCLEWHRQWPTRPVRTIHKATTFRRHPQGDVNLCAACALQFDQEREALHGLD